MTFSSSLTDNYSTLVLDTSVIINLEASGIGKEILRVIDNDFATTMEVANDIKEISKILHQKTISFLDSIVASELLPVLSQTDSEKRIHREILNIRSRLSESEVATIALAKSRSFTPIVDEKLGRRIASEVLLGHLVGRTLDVLLHPRVLSHFDQVSVNQAIYKALRVGRMQISKDDCDFVVGLIG